MRSVDNAIRVNSIEDIQYKLKILTAVLKRFATFTLEDSCVQIVIVIDVFSARVLSRSDWKEP